MRIIGNGIGHEFLVRYQGDARHAAADSAVVAQYSRATITVAAGMTGPLRAGAVSRITGVASVIRVGSKIQLQRSTSHGWVPAGAATIVGSNGRFGMFWRVGSTGFYRLYVGSRTSALDAAAGSRTYPIVVR